MSFAHLLLNKRLEFYYFCLCHHILLQQELLELYDRIFPSPLLDLFFRPDIRVRALDVVIRADMTVHSVRQELKKHGTLASAAESDGLFRLGMNLEDVVAVHPETLLAERLPNLEYPVADADLTDGKMGGIEVVLTGEDQGKSPKRREIQGFAENAFSRRSIAEERRSPFVLRIDEARRRRVRARWSRQRWRRSSMPTCGSISALTHRGA